MSIIRSISTGNNVVIIELDKSQSVEVSLQNFLREVGFNRNKRKNLFKGHVGINIIEKSKRGIDDYADSIQYVENKHVSIAIFTGANKVIMVIHANKQIRRKIPDIFNRCFA